MATSFQAYVDRENIANPGLKSISKPAAQGPAQRRLSAKTFHESKNPQPTPRKALGDLLNFQKHGGTGKKFETPKPKLKIFQDTPKTNQRKSTKSRKGTFSVFNANRADSKTGEAKTRTSNENSFPEIEKMTPFVDQEDDFTTPQYIRQLLQHPRILNPSSIFPPRKFEIDDDDDSKTFPSDYEYDTIRQPCFDDTLANIIGYDGKLEFCEVKTDLPSLDDIPLDFPLMLP